MLRAGIVGLSDKPTIFACNVKEGDLATADTNPYVMKVRGYVRTHLSCEAVVISARIESDLVDLAPDEADAFLQDLGVEESGIGALIRSTYHLLGLHTSSPRARRRSARGRSATATRRRRRRASSTPTSSAGSSRPRRSRTTIS
jgi:ribosome-binding ATPase YchF (GTP1/OBG family)